MENQTTETENTNSEEIIDEKEDSSKSIVNRSLGDEQDKNNPSKKKLKGIGQLLKESWLIYRSRFNTVLKIVSILFIPLILSVLLYITTESENSLFLSLPLQFINAILILLVALALIYSVKDELGVWESYKKGMSATFPLIWILILAQIAFLGGSLLFVVPGILFGVWFLFSPFTFIFEGKRGKSALDRSKQLASGRFIEIIVRNIVIGLIISTINNSLPLVLGIIMGSFASLVGISEMIETVILSFGGILAGTISLLILPIPIFYYTLLYNDLVKDKENIPYQEPSKGYRIVYSIAVILGIMFFVSIPVFYFLIGRDSEKSYFNQNSEVMSNTNNLKEEAKDEKFESKRIIEVKKREELTIFYNEIQSSIQSVNDILDNTRNKILGVNERLQKEEIIAENAYEEIRVISEEASSMINEHIVLLEKLYISENIPEDDKKEIIEGIILIKKAYLSYIEKETLQLQGNEILLLFYDDEEKMKESTILFQKSESRNNEAISLVADGEIKILKVLERHDLYYDK